MFKERSEKFRDQLGTTYRASTIALEYGVMDLHIYSTSEINSSALKVVCPPPGHGRKIKKVLETITPPLTLPPAVLVSKVES